MKALQPVCPSPPVILSVPLASMALTEWAPCSPFKSECDRKGKEHILGAGSRGLLKLCVRLGLPLLLLAGLQGGNGVMGRRDVSLSICLVSSQGWPFHQACLHSQVSQTTEADKDVSGLGAPAVTLSLDRSGLTLAGKEERLWVSEKLHSACSKVAEPEWFWCRLPNLPSLPPLLLLAALPFPNPIHP